MRTRKLIRPEIQLRLSAYFLGLVLFALIFQFLLVTSSMSKLILMEGDYVDRQEMVTEASLEILLVSLAVILPLTLGVGILVTFRLAGPIARFQAFLQEMISGQRPGDIVLRQGDQLKDVAQLLNEATRPLRTAGHGNREHAANPVEAAGPRQAA